MNYSFAKKHTSKTHVKTTDTHRRIVHTRYFAIMNTQEHTLKPSNTNISQKTLFFNRQTSKAQSESPAVIVRLIFLASRCIHHKS